MDVVLNLVQRRGRVSCQRVREQNAHATALGFILFKRMHYTAVIKVGGKLIEIDSQKNLPEVVEMSVIFDAEAAYAVYRSDVAVEGIEQIRATTVWEEREMQRADKPQGLSGSEGHEAVRAPTNSPSDPGAVKQAPATEQEQSIDDDELAIPEQAHITQAPAICPLEDDQP